MTSPNPNKYYRVPHVIVEQPSDYTAAFTMRLLNFLYKLGMKAQSPIRPPQIDIYAKRYTK